jgi:hypothetical protein
MEDLEGDVAQLRANLNVKTALLCDSMAEVERLRTRLAEVETELQILRNEILILQSELRTSRHGYELILNSTSWRMTAPLRFIMQIFHRSP